MVIIAFILRLRIDLPIIPIPVSFSLKPDPLKNQIKNTAWWPLVLPFAIFMVATMFEPKLGDLADSWPIDLPTNSESALAPESNPDDAGTWTWANPACRYFIIYSIKIVSITVLLAYCLPIYRDHFPFKLSWWGVVVGLLGGVLWIALCYLQIERTVASAIGLPEGWFASRSAVNPAIHFEHLLPLSLFYFIRFSGLVLIVPFIEELFLRGFFIRYIEDPEWWAVKFNRLGWLPLCIAPIYGVLAHPLSEALAAAAWFGLITWLMVRTRNLWDCVSAHALTNLMLGIYVIWFEQWHLW